MRFSDGQVFSEMQAFVAVAQSHSFARAAERLGVDPPNLSRIVSRLEKRVELRLLNRTTRSVSLTSAGIGYLDYCVKMLAHFDEAQEFIESERNGISGPIRITIPMTFGLTRLGPILSAFSHAHPKVRVEALVTDDLLDLTAQRIDVGIRMGATVDANLHARFLGRTNRVLCASPRYIEENGIPRSPNELLDHKCLVFSSRPQANVWTLKRDGLIDETLTVNPVLSANNSLLLREMAISDIGIAPIAEYVIASSLADNSLVRVLPEWTLGSLDICAVYLSSRNMSPKVRAFIDFCVINMSAPESK